MGGTELKTDSLQRWMMYSKDAYGSGRIFLTLEQKQAVEEGKKFSQRACADVWARDDALARRASARFSGRTSTGTSSWRKIFGDMIHSMKDDLQLGGADNVTWHDNGDVEFKRQIIGNMHDYK
jgi:hypothetical protein